MSKFLEELEYLIVDKVSSLPVDRNLERIVSLYCNKAYKNKLENEITNRTITVHNYSNHSQIGEYFIVHGIKVRLIIDEHYNDVIVKAGYYDKGSK